MRQDLLLRPGSGGQPLGVCSNGCIAGPSNGLAHLEEPYIPEGRWRSPQASCYRWTMVRRRWSADWVGPLAFAEFGVVTHRMAAPFTPGHTMLTWARRCFRW